MRRVHVLAEGQTEETFVRDVLAPWLGERGVMVSASRVTTGRSAGRVHKGGLTNYERTKRELMRFLAADEGRFVTTMFDYYGLPTDFPRPGALTNGLTPHEVAHRLEQALSADLGYPTRLLPYVQMHEFEALVFAASRVATVALGLSDRQASDLLRTVATHATPEHIDDGPATAPSKRLLALHPPYDKLLDGARITSLAGVDSLRDACPHFSDWVSRLLGE